MFGWFGTITGIIGGLLISLNFEYSYLAFLFFLSSAISWVIQAYKNNDNSLILLNSFFILI